MISELNLNITLVDDIVELFQNVWLLQQNSLPPGGSSKAQNSQLVTPSSSHQNKEMLALL